MTARTCAFALIAALTTGPLAAQNLLDRIDQAVDLPVEEWSEMAAGRTLTYRIDGVFWALERYHPDGNRVTLQIADGTCLEGVWDYNEPHYCFYWERDGTACFRHTRLDDEIVIIQTEDGVDTGLLQTMTAVSDIPLVCGPAVTS